MRSRSRPRCRRWPIKARPRPERLGRLAVAAVCVLWAGLAIAAPQRSASASEAKTELESLKIRIEELGRDLAATEETKADAADQLRETEKAISDANRRLRELGQERDAHRRELNALSLESDRIGKRIAAQQAELARILYRSYLGGQADALRLVLAGSDPNQVARDLHLLSLLSRAQAELIGRLRADLRSKQALAGQVRERSAALSATEAGEQRARSLLLDQQGKHKAVLASISGRIRVQRREIETLRRDERRLSKLIEGLSRIVTPPGAKPERDGQSGRQRGVPVDKVADASLAGEPFTRLKGKLRLPVRGELLTRFGARRLEGGVSKGLFIRADNGNEIRAVASGRVVFADWLRGFGNLLILDHGEGYLTVYGNNEALLKTIGQPARAGEPIASVGASGGSPETGLYFELRHEGRPIDPLKWVNPR